MTISEHSKRPVESFLVSKGDQALLAAGTDLYTATGASNANDGQLAFINAATNKAFSPATSGDTYDTIPDVYLAFGTPDFNNPGQSGVIGKYNEVARISGKIKGENLRSISAQTYRAPVLNTWVIGAPTTPVNDTEYSIKIGFRGRRMDERNSLHGRSSLTPRITSGNPSNASDIIKALVIEINANSQSFTEDGRKGNLPIVAFAVNNAGGVGGTTLTAASAAAGGVAITVEAGKVFTTDGETIAGAGNSSAGAGIATAIGENGLAGTSEIIDAEGVEVADNIIIIALDERVAANDDIKQLKTRIDLALFTGFESTNFITETSNALEAIGDARTMQIAFSMTQGLRLNSQYRHDPYLAQDPSYIVPGQIYTLFTIEHANVSQAAITGVAVLPMVEYILVPNGDTNTLHNPPGTPAAPGADSIQGELEAYFKLAAGTLEP